jgi:large subunit ribosomal protein L13
MEKKTQLKEYTIDAEGQIVGRLATKIAAILQGRTSAAYNPRLPGGNRVIVKNAAKVKFSGLKETQKMYYHHAQHKQTHKLFHCCTFPNNSLGTAEPVVRTTDRHLDNILKYVKCQPNEATAPTTQSRDSSRAHRPPWPWHWLSNCTQHTLVPYDQILPALQPLQTLAMRCMA